MVRRFAIAGWVTTLAMILFACATTDGGKMRQGFSAGLTAAETLTQVAKTICKPVLAKCIAEKKNPCPELQRCGKTKARILMGAHAFTAAIREANTLTRSVK